MPEGLEADGVEPDAPVSGAEDQAPDQQSSSPWDPYFTEHDIPEAVEPFLRDAFKHADGLSTQKFQEHSEYRKQWEPYEKAGLHEWDPESLSEALQVIESFNDPEQAKELVSRMARELGLIEADDEDDLGDDDLDDTPDITSLLDQRLGPIEQFVQQQAQDRQRQEAESYIESSFQAIEKDLGRKLTASEDEQVRDLAGAYASRGEQDPIKLAWDRFKSIKTDLEKNLVAQKRGEPGRAETGPSAPVGRASNGDLSLEQQGQQELMARIAAMSE